MKKTTQIIGMMCMVGLLAIGSTSCKKETAKTVSSFDITLPAIEGDAPFDDAKAYIDMMDGGKMKWYQGDNVMMYSIDEDYTNSQVQEFTGDAQTGDAQAHFSGTPMNVGDVGFFAFYPASKASTTIGKDNRATFNVGNTQTYVTDLFANTSRAGLIFMDPQCFVGAATCDVIEPSANFVLKPIFGYINVRIKDSNASDKRVKSVTITDSQRNLTGTMSVLIPALKSADLDAMKQLGVNYKNNGNIDTYMTQMESKLHEIGYMADGNGHSVTLNVEAANEGMGATINGSYKYFLIPIRPGALMGDFTVTLSFFGEDDMEISVPADKKYISIPGYYTNVSIDLKNGGTVL